jgi:holo-ACP synthase
MTAVTELVGGSSIGIDEMLAARDQRAARQSEALARFNKPIVSITVIMPGPIKDGVLPRGLLRVALQELDVLASQREWRVLLRQTLSEETGPEAIYVLDTNPELLKLATVELEDNHPLGRFWDLDVIAPGPRLLSRKQLALPVRRCLMCDRPAFECSRSRRHSVEELQGAIQRIADDYDAFPGEQE